MKAFIAFDLGNALLPFDHMTACRAIASEFGLDPLTVYARIFSGGLARQFELGTLSASAFTRECSRALAIDLDERTFEPLWSDIFLEDQEMVRLVARLAPSVNLCLISNTNEWHFQWVARRFPVLDDFPVKILSYEIGRMKPDPEVFRVALGHVAPGQRSIFIDDIEENTRAAAAMGFEPVHYTGVARLETTLSALGVSPDISREVGASAP